MPRDLEREVVVLRNSMAQCFRETLLARELRPTVLLAVLDLHLTLRDIHRARDPAQRQALTREFDQGQEAVRKLIDRAYQEPKERTTKSQSLNPDQRAA